MSERTIEKARQVVHRLSEWYFAGGGDNDPDSPIDREDLDALHDLVRTAEATAEMERRQAGAYADVAAVVRRELEAPGAGEDVRERVAREVFALDADWRRGYWDQFRRDCPRQAQAYYDTADRILGLCRAPRGEGEAEPVAWRVEYRRRGDGDARWYHLSTYTNEMDARERAKHAEGAMRVLECRIIPLYASPAAALLRTLRGDGEAWRAFLDALDEFEAAANLWADPEGPTAADMERLCLSRQRVIECARVLGVCRSEAQGEERASEYGALLAFADAISDAVWGGERAWEQDGGLERLSQKVRRWAKERAALRSDAQGELVKEAVALIDEAVSEIAG